MASYRVKFQGVDVECATAEEAAALIALKMGNGSPPAPAPSPGPDSPTEPAAPDVFDRPGTSGRGVEALREIEGAGKLIWNWLTSEKDPRSAILEALERAGKR